MGFLAAEVPDQVVDKGKTNEFKLGESRYGKMIPFGYGTVRVPGNVIWAAEIEEEKETTTSNSGGKGIGATQKTTNVNWTYYASFAVAFGEGTAFKITKLWADTKVIYENFGGTGQGDLFRFYPGDEDQKPDPLIVEAKGAENTPAFRGLTYIVFERLNLRDFGNRIPSITAEIVYEGTTNSGSIDDGIEVTTGESTSVPMRLGTMVADYTRGVVYGQRNAGGDTIYTLSMGSQQIVDTVEPEVAGFKLQGLFEPEGHLIGNVSGRPYIINANTGEVEFSGLVGETRFTGECAQTYAIQDDVRRDLILTVDRSNIINIGRTFIIDINDEIIYVTDVGVSTDNGIVEVSNPINLESGAMLVSFCRKISATRSANSYFKIFINTDGGTALEDRGTVYSDDTELSEINTTDMWRGRPTLGYHIPSGEILTIHSGIGGIPPFAYKVVLGESRFALLEKIIWANSLGEESNFLTTMDQQVDNKQGYNERLSGNTYIMAGGDNLNAGVLNLITGDFSLIIRDPDFNTPSMTSQSGFYDGQDGVVYTLGTGQSLDKIQFTTARKESSSRAITIDLLQRAGLEPWDDIERLNNPVFPIQGYLCDDASSVREYLTPLVELFRYDLIESDGRIKLLKRTGTHSVVINQSKFIEQEENYEQNRVQEAEIPHTIEISYSEREGNYDSSLQRASRARGEVTTVQSNLKKEYSTTMVLDGALVVKQAEILLSTAWLERTTYSFMLTWQYIYLDVGDVVRLQFSDGTVVDCRIEKMVIGADLSIEVTVRQTEEEQFVSVKKKAPTIIKTQRPPIVEKAKPHYLDIPLLSSIDDVNRKTHTQYIAASPFKSPSRWAGSMLYDMTPDPVDFITAIDNATPWGYITNTITNPIDPYITQTGTVINVKVVYGIDQFISRSMLQVLNGDNLIAIESVIQTTTGVQRGWELAQFQNVTPISTDKIQLSTFLRGRKGTESFVNHIGSTGSRRLLLLNSRSLYGKFQMPLTTTTAKFGFLTEREFLNQAVVTDTPIYKRSLMPYAPTKIKTNNSGGNILYSWERRTRTGDDDLRDGVDGEPLEENTESYDLVIMEGKVAGVWVTLSAPRTVTGLTTRSYTYNNIDIINDFGAIPTDLRTYIYQNSFQVGRGFEKLTQTEVT
jgi:Putative phage tail protein